MKIVDLNAWGGTLWSELSKYLINEKIDTDVFCFQEVTCCNTGFNPFESGVRKDLYGDLEKLLDEYAFVKFQDENYGYNSALVFCIKKDISFSLDQKMVLCGEMYTDPVLGEAGNFGILQTIFLEKEKLFLINFHGIWKPGDKLDNELRILQSEKLVSFMKKLKGNILLIGDFNLNPKTRSIELISNVLKNLNQEFSVTDTRGRGTKYWGKADYQPYSDYAFCSKELMVNSFEAKDIVVSDHKPLVLII